MVYKFRQFQMFNYLREVNTKILSVLIIVNGYCAQETGTVNLIKMSQIFLVTVINQNCIEYAGNDNKGLPKIPPSF